MAGILFLAPMRVTAQSIDAFYDAADTFLATYVEEGRIEYAALKSDPEPLKRLIGMIATMDRAALSPTDEQAFLIDAYNLLVIDNVVEHYPIASPLDVEGFFDSDTFTLSGTTFTLNQLEKEELFRIYPDPRLHFVLVCAAVGCPVLLDAAYRGNDLDTQLNRQTRQALNDERHVRIDAQAGALKVSEIFSWYEQDFTQNGRSVPEFIGDFRNAPLQSDLKVEYIPYDWVLNDVRRQP